MVFLQMVFDVLPPRRQCLRENKNDVLPLQRSRDLQGSWARGQKRMTQELKMLLGVTSISLLTLLTISQLEQHQKAGFQNKDSTITMLILFLSQGQEDGGRWRPMRSLFHNGSVIGTTHCFYSKQQKMLQKFE